MPEYLQRNFGPSFRTEQAMREIERAVCTGIHEERKLLFTDGLAREAYEGTDPRAQSLRASYEKNLEMLRTHGDAARQGRRSIEQAFRNALSLRSEPLWWSFLSTRAARSPCGKAWWRCKATFSAVR